MNSRNARNEVRLAKLTLWTSTRVDAGKRSSPSRNSIPGGTEKLLWEAALTNILHEPLKRRETKFGSPNSLSGRPRARTLGNGVRRAEIQFREATKKYSGKQLGETLCRNSRNARKRIDRQTHFPSVHARGRGETEFGEPKFNSGRH